MKNIKHIFLLLTSLLTLSSCSGKEFNETAFYFDTYVNFKLFEGEKDDINKLKEMCEILDKLTDNYSARDINNVYKINSSSDYVEVHPQLYQILKLSLSSDLSALKYFNPLCGSLSKKWKGSLSNKKVLDQQVISEELNKIATSSLDLSIENKVKRVGDAEIDLGAVAKGFALDLFKGYFDHAGYTKYIVDAGSSSILLGEKPEGEDFKIKISDLDNAYLNLKNCFVSTSSHSRQEVEIDGKIYSHIINPVTGSAINENDAVIVISKYGYIGDILSTAFVNESLDSIKELEKQFDVKTIVIKNKQIAYKTEGIEVTNKWKKNIEMTSF